MDRETQKLLQRRENILGKTELFYDTPIHLVKGSGIWLWDNQGNKYMDVYNNVAHLGHCHPKVVDAIVSQLKLLNTHTRYLHTKILELGERLTQSLVPGLSKVFMVNSGSEANELALRIARKWTSKKGIIVAQNAYHGNTQATLEISTEFIDKTSNIPYVKSIPIPHDLNYSVDKNKEYLTHLNDAINQLENDGYGVAALIFCSAFSTNGLANVPHIYISEAVTRVRESGAIYISDEVQSGFGRMGKMWGFEGYGITPDIITTGKPMGNGHPVAAVVSRTDLCEKFQTDGDYFNTFGGNPVSCAAVLAVLEVIEQDHLVEHASETGKYVQELMAQLVDNFEIINSSRGQGLFFGLEIVDSSGHADSVTASLIVNLLRHNGILISKTGLKNNILKMRPPMICKKDNIDHLVDKLHNVINKVHN